LNSIHDCGGMEGFGPIPHGPDGPVFASDWERRAFALMSLSTASGAWTIDEARHSIEQMTASDYLRASYYEKWLQGLETMVRAKGLAERKASAALQRPAARPVAGPRFEAGDRVMTRNISPHGHTRLPRYARGKAGVVLRHYGVHRFADTNAHGDPKPQHLYVIGFKARELWGEDASPADTVCIDLWDDHLDAAT